MCRSCQCVHTLLCVHACVSFVCTLACVCVCVRVCVAYGEGRNLGIRTRRGPCVASSRACRTDKGWDLTAALPVRGKKRAEQGTARTRQECSTVVNAICTGGINGVICTGQMMRSKRAGGPAAHGDSIASASVSSPNLQAFQQRSRRQLLSPKAAGSPSSESRCRSSTASFHLSTSPLFSFVHLLARLIGTPLVSPN